MTSPSGAGCLASRRARAARASAAECGRRRAPPHPPDRGQRGRARGAARRVTLAGHDVYEAADGPTGIDLARTHAAEVALIDVGLPGLVGYEVARRIRASQGSHAMRLIAITGYGQAEDRHRARDAGFDAHLTTPVSPERLAAAALSPGPGTTTRSADPNQRPCHASWVYPPTFWDLRCWTDTTTSCNRGADDRRPLAGGLAIPSPAHVAVSSTTPAWVGRWTLARAPRAIPAEHAVQPSGSSHRAVAAEVGRRGSGEHPRKLLARVAVPLLQLSPALPASRVVSRELVGACPRPDASP